MSDSDSSALSSAPSSGDEKLAPIFLNAKGKKTKKGALVPLIPVPPPRIRTPSPELPETLADNPDIAVCVDNYALPRIQLMFYSSLSCFAIASPMLFPQSSRISHLRISNAAWSILYPLHKSKTCYALYWESC